MLTIYSRELKHNTDILKASVSEDDGWISHFKVNGMSARRSSLDEN